MIYALTTLARCTLCGHRPENALCPRCERVLSDKRRVLDRLDEFCSPEESQEWLAKHSGLFGGQSPTELINEGRTDEVMEAIDSLVSRTYL